MNERQIEAINKVLDTPLGHQKSELLEIISRDYERLGTHPAYLKALTPIQAKSYPDMAVQYSKRDILIAATYWATRSQGKYGLTALEAKDIEQVMKKYVFDTSAATISLADIDKSRRLLQRIAHNHMKQAVDESEQLFGYALKQYAEHAADDIMNVLLFNHSSVAPEERFNGHKDYERYLRAHYSEVLPLSQIKTLIVKAEELWPDAHNQRQAASQKRSDFFYTVCKKIEQHLTPTSPALAGAEKKIIEQSHSNSRIAHDISRAISVWKEMGETLGLAMPSIARPSASFGSAGRGR
jgi:hypothetical protein